MEDGVSEFLNLVSEMFCMRNRDFRKHHLLALNCSFVDANDHYMLDRLRSLHLFLMLLSTQESRIQTFRQIQF